MKNLVTTILFLLFAIPALASQYQVTRVVDGDTIDVIYKGKKGFFAHPPEICNKPFS